MRSAIKVHGLRAGCAGAALAIVVDRSVGDPPDAWHPVAWFGTAMSRVERWTWRDARAAGVVHLAIGVGIAAAAGVALARAGSRSGLGRVALAFVPALVATGGGGLDRAARRVGDALAVGDLGSARQQLPWLVGRDPSGLDEGEVARAAVESVAENTVDAVVAPAWWAAVAGPCGVLVYRAANTLDAMVGHHSPRYERFGWAAAKLDDAANVVPARVAAALVAAVRPHRARAVWRAVRRDAPNHPSPSAGVVEAAFAAALGVRLGGTNDYGDRREVRASLGDGSAARVADIARACRLARDVDLALAAVLLAPVVAPTVAAAERRVRRASPRRGVAR